VHNSPRSLVRIALVEVASHTRVRRGIQPTLKDVRTPAPGKSWLIAFSGKGANGSVVVNIALPGRSILGCESISEGRPTRFGCG
jgi:hypothetical protein